MRSGCRRPQTTLTVACAAIILAACNSGLAPARSDESPPNSPQTTTTARADSAARSDVPPTWPWQAVSVGLLIIALVTSVQSAALYRWRRKLADGQVSVVPEILLSGLADVRRAYEHQTHSLENVLRQQRDQGREVQSAFKVFSAIATDKDAQIQRLQSGSDKQAYYEFIRPFVRVLRLLDSDIEDDEAAGKDASSVRSLRRHLASALADAGVEPFVVPSGDDYRVRNDVAEPPEIENTSDESKDWLVVQTTKPGFRLLTGNEPLLVERAVVRIYRYKEQA